MGLSFGIAVIEMREIFLQDSFEGRAILTGKIRDIARVDLEQYFITGDNTPVSSRSPQRLELSRHNLPSQ
jgi:hypothetical protein